MGEYFYQIQEYIAWCIRGADGEIGRPLRTFDIPIGQDGLMIPQIANGEVEDPHATTEPIAMEEGSGVILADPEPMDDEEPEEIIQDVDEEGEVVEVGSDEELDPADNLRLYLDPEMSEPRLKIWRSSSPSL